MDVELFFALLRPGDTGSGWGAYDRVTGAVVTIRRAWAIGFLRWGRAGQRFIFAMDSCIGLTLRGALSHKRIAH